jgi:hypothetical protein
MKWLLLATIGDLLDRDEWGWKALSKTGHLERIIDLAF